MNTAFATDNSKAFSEFLFVFSFKKIIDLFFVKTALKHQKAFERYCYHCLYRLLHKDICSNKVNH